MCELCSLCDSIQTGVAGRGNKVRTVSQLSLPPLYSQCLLSVPLGSGWLCDLKKKSSHIALAVMASNTVASKSMEPVLDFAAVSTLSL